MNHLARENNLLLKAERDRCIGRYLGPDDFQRDACTLQQLISRLVDLAHPATSNKAHNQESICDQLGRLKAARRRICSRHSNRWIR